jgi:hypothetical protein
MCPAFERVERIVQNMVDKAEKVGILIKTEKRGGGAAALTER